MNRREFLQGLIVALSLPVLGKRGDKPQAPKTHFKVGDRVTIRPGVLDYDFAKPEGYRDIGGWTGIIDVITASSVWVIFDYATRIQWSSAYRRGLWQHGFRERESFSFTVGELM